MVVADLGPTLEQLVDEHLPVEGVGQRLADFLLGELARVAAHPDLAMQGGRRRDEAEVRVVDQRRAREDVELDDGVDLVALVGGDHRAGRVEEEELGAVERGLAAPPVRVALEGRAGLLVVADELPGAGPVGPLVGGRAGHVVGRGDDRLGVVDRDEVREVAVAAGERERDGVVIGRDRATGLEDALEAGVAGRDEALHRGDDVGGRERRRRSAT